MIFQTQKRAVLEHFYRDLPGLTGGGVTLILFIFCRILVCFERFAFNILKYYKNTAGVVNRCVNKLFACPEAQTPAEVSMPVEFVYAGSGLAFSPIHGHALVRGLGFRAYVNLLPQC